jgi:hypothetical protein
MAPVSPIALRGKACAQHFDQLCTLFEDERRQLSFGISHLQACDCYGQFKIWAGNIGALQTIQIPSSLDYRLREAPKVSQQVVSLLEDLEEALEDGAHSFPLRALTVITSLTATPSMRNRFRSERKPSQLSGTIRCRHTLPWCGNL